jgi:HK97 family phage major capsid protein
MTQPQIEQKLDTALGILENSLHEEKSIMTKQIQTRPLFDTKSSESSGSFYSKSHGLPAGLLRKSLTSHSGSGALMPPELMSRIQDNLSKISPMRKVSRANQITADSLEVILAQGGTETGWTHELDAPSETNLPELKKVKIPLHTLYARPRISQQILEDGAVDLESWVIDMVSSSISQQENKAFTIGDGEGKPFGFLNHPTSPHASETPGTVECFKTGKHGDIDGPDVLIEMATSLKPEYLNGACWMMPRSVLTIMRIMQDESTGRHLWQPRLTAEFPETLLGYPVIINDDMPPLKPGTSSISLAFGNFNKAYQIVEKEGLTILRDPYSAKPYVELYITKRVGGQVICPEAIKFLSFEGEA